MLRALLLATAIVTTPKPIPITAPELWKAYRHDEKAADAKYKDKRVLITGTVAKVSLTYTFYLNAEDPGQLSGVTVVPGDHQIMAMAKYHVGDKLTANCLCVGNGFNEPILLYCELP
jgi:hypothetical protein